MAKKYYLDYMLLGAFLSQRRKKICRSRKEFVKYLSDRGIKISYSTLVRIEDGDIAAINNNLDLINMAYPKKTTIDKRPYEKIESIGEELYNTLCSDNRIANTNIMIKKIKRLKEEYDDYAYIGDLLSLYIVVCDYVTKSITNDRDMYDLFGKLFQKLHYYDKILAEYYLYSVGRRLVKKAKDIDFFILGKELSKHSLFLLDQSSYYCYLLEPYEMAKYFEDRSNCYFDDSPKLSEYARHSCLAQAYFNLHMYKETCELLSSSLTIYNIEKLLPDHELAYAKMRLGLVYFYIDDYENSYANLKDTFEKDPNYLFLNVIFMCIAGEKEDKYDELRSILNKCKIEKIKRPSVRYIIEYYTMKYNEEDPSTLEKYLVNNFHIELIQSKIYIDMINKELLELTTKTKHYQNYFKFAMRIDKLLDN